MDFHGEHGVTSMLATVMTMNEDAEIYVKKPGAIAGESAGALRRCNHLRRHAWSSRPLRWQWAHYAARNVFGKIVIRH